jgi:Ca2+-binding EF-hand superfamily protein
MPLTRDRRRFVALVAAIGFVAVSPFAALQAQSPDRAERVLKALDKDNDATVDLNEAKLAASAYFISLDAHNDGTLTLQEFQAPLKSALVRAGPESRSRLERALAAREAAFKAMDKDHDGTVSKDEYLAEVEIRFNRADRDHEGTLSLEELRTPAGRALTTLLHP